MDEQINCPNCGKAAYWKVIGDKRQAECLDCGVKLVERPLDFPGVIRWIRTHNAEQIQEFLYHVLLKGAELTLNAVLEPDNSDWDEYFDAVATAVEGTPLLVETLYRAIDATEEPYTEGVSNPFAPGQIRSEE